MMRAKLKLHCEIFSKDTRWGVGSLLLGAAFLFLTNNTNEENSLDTPRNFPAPMLHGHHLLTE